MVKVESVVNGDHTDVSVSMEGIAIEIANETVSAIEALMSDLKKNSAAKRGTSTPRRGGNQRG